MPMLWSVDMSELRLPKAFFFLRMISYNPFPVIMPSMFQRLPTTGTGEVNQVLHFIHRKASLNRPLKNEFKIAFVITICFPLSL
jgi:hypothetical protein